MIIVVWHRRDLRIHDNRALYEASTKTRRIIPVFCVDPHFFTSQRYHPTRYTFLYNSLVALDASYRSIGSSLVILFGNPLERIPMIGADAVYFNNDTNGAYGNERDKHAISLGFIGWDNDAIQRQGKHEWQDYAKQYFSRPQYITPERLIPHRIQSDIDIHHFFSSFMTSSYEEGGETKGIARLQEFLCTINTYPSSISPPLQAEHGTSRLSAYFSFGVLSPRKAFQEASKVSHWGKKFFISRLFWREHFTQKLIIYPFLYNKPICRYIEQYYSSIYNEDKHIHHAWLEGRTGYPLVDASMRALTTTGYINFRMRAMIASFYTYILQQPWKHGADAMFYNLTDADRAINYYQWQMQSGITGIHPFRIYNPTKNLQELDPACEFVKKYIPELRTIQNDIILMDPEERMQSIFADAYYPPIVSFRERSKYARTLYASIHKQHTSSS